MICSSLICHGDLAPVHANARSSWWHRTSTVSADDPAACMCNVYAAISAHQLGRLCRTIWTFCPARRCVPIIDCIGWVRLLT